MALDSTLTRQDNLMPQRTGGMRKGTAMALLVHAGLLVALAFGVSWRSQTPVGVSAELWAAVPQIAAPPVVEPKPVPTPTPTPPPPPKPRAEEAPPKPSQTEAQIAIEKEKAERKQREQRELQERERKEQQERERQEQERVEREKAEKLAAQKQRELEIKRQKEDEARLAKQHEENVKRMLGQAGGTGAPNSPGTAAREAGPSSSYAGRIVRAVKPNIFFTDEVPGNPSADVEVRCAPDGAIVSRRLVKSSGNKEWDEAVLRALDRTGKLPPDTDGSVPSRMEIAFRPRE
ncbi:MAG: energy transducer TonB [Burkholderiales bacterium]